ncbi:unnamed protein product [Clavelina lepadiformis]|uniref:Uncharacterized protein n=1 Tax=Clavelina lepadiformis TaxID=159417 RepID=A0ABP0G655_CLALP
MSRSHCFTHPDSGWPGLLQYFPELNSRAVFCLPEFLEQPGCRCLAAVRVLKAVLFPAENLGAASCLPKLCSGGESASRVGFRGSLVTAEYPSAPLSTTEISSFPADCGAISLPPESPSRLIAAGSPDPRNKETTKIGIFALKRGKCPGMPSVMIRDKKIEGKDKSINELRFNIHPKLPTALSFPTSCN